MCIVFLAISGKQIKNNGYKLIVASNRDEYFHRRTQPAHFWPSHPHILSGTDGDGIGTWLAITKSGRFGVLTNYRQGCKNTNPLKRSRGGLLSDFLTGKENPQKYMDKVKQSSNLYNGFNLIVGDVSSNEFSYYCNQDHQPSQKLESGIYGLSNRYLDFEWKKVVFGKEKFGKIVDTRSSLQNKIPHLMTLLQDTTIYPDDSNFMGPQDHGSHTFTELLPLTAISPLMSTNPGKLQPNYGTRTNTVIVVDNDDNVTFVERTMVEPINFDTGITWKTNTFQFKLDASAEKRELATCRL